MTTNTSSADCQVLVVGAGPTGLTLAAQLLSRGVQTRLVDKGAGPATQSRALGVHARTLEVLDTMGLADAFIARGHRVRYVHMHVVLAWREWQHCAAPAPHGYLVVVDQDLRPDGAKNGVKVAENWVVIAMRTTQMVTRAMTAPTPP